MLTLFHSDHSDLGCPHSHESLGRLGPKDGLWWGWRSWEEFAKAMSPPRGPISPTPLCPGPNLQIRRVLWARNSACCAQRMWEPLGWKSFRKSPVGSMSPGGGVPASFLWVVPPVDESTVPRCCRNWDLAWGPGIRKRNGTHALSAVINPGTGFSPRHWFLQ